MAEIIAGGVMATAMMFRLGIALLNFFGLYRIFQKMGLPGWKGIIPLYNTYNLFDKVWDSKYFWTYLVTQICVTMPVEENCALWVSLGILAMAILGIVLELKLYIALSKAFGKGTGFGVLTFFFAPICLAVLGFGSAEYNGTKKANF